MSDKKLFKLPDLGEGLPDAEIVEWLVKEGDVIRLDEPLVSMETAKAVVEVPSPFSGKVTRLAGKAGDVIETGSWLVEIELDPSLPQRADAQDTGHSHGHKGAGNPVPNEESRDDGDDLTVVASDEGGEIREEPEDDAEDAGDAGTVVGAMQSSNAVRSEQAVAVGGVRAMPAVRALARKLKVDLARVKATGTDGVVTAADVKKAAADGSAPMSARGRTNTLPPPPAGEGRGGGSTKSDAGGGGGQHEVRRAPLPASPRKRGEGQFAGA